MPARPVALTPIMQHLPQLPDFYGDLALVAVEIAALFLVYLVLRVPLGIVRRRLAAGPERTRGRAVAARVAGMSATLLLVALILGSMFAVGFAVYLFLQGEGVLGGTVRRIQALPPDYFQAFGFALAKAAGAIAVTLLVVVIARRTLSFVQRRALAWERLTANDAAVDAFFNLLKAVVTTGLWLSVMAVVAIWLGLPRSVPALLLLALRVYLIGAIGLLLVRGIASVVDTLDAMSAKFAGPTTLLRYYHDLRGLVPLLRRCVELAIWLGVASLVVLQIESTAAFAVYGPRLIQAVGVFFVARVAAEAADLIITRSQGDTEGLSDTERQQRATLIPLVLSFVRGAIYFVALVVMLTVLDLNPLPLLAGAGILGVVVGFGAQPVITDVVSGFFILFENQFLVGDYVEIGNARGVVEAIQLRTTRIRDPNGQQHIVRNGLMSGVVNYSKAYTFAVVELEVRYETDLRQVYNVLTGIGSEFATDHQDVLEPTVVSGVERFTGSGIVIRTTTKVRPGTHGQVARDLRQAILTAFATKGLKMPTATASS